MKAEMCMSNKTEQFMWQVEFSEQYIIKMILAILDERIKRAEVALKIIRHSKRKAVLIKLHRALVQFHKEQTERLSVMDDELPTLLEG